MKDWNHQKIGLVFGSIIIAIIFIFPPLLITGLITLNVLPTCSNGAIAPNGNIALCGAVAGSNGQLVSPNNQMSNINQYFFCSPQQLNAGYVTQINNGQLTCVPPYQINIYSNSNTTSTQVTSQQASAANTVLASGSTSANIQKTSSSQAPFPSTQTTTTSNNTNVFFNWWSNLIAFITAWFSSLMGMH